MSNKLQDEIINWCYENNITEFCVLKMYAIKNRRDWSKELSKNCYQVIQFLNSYKYGKNAKTYNEETGEQFF